VRAELEVVITRAIEAVCREVGECSGGAQTLPSHVQCLRSQHTMTERPSVGKPQAQISVPNGQFALGDGHTELCARP
jgi:hypothetical protein